MSIFKYILIIFFLIISKVDANTKIVFIDIDYLINNSSIGKSTLNKLDEINSKNLKILDDNEKNFEIWRNK